MTEEKLFDTVDLYISDDRTEINIDMNILSMGMSADYYEAVLAGANMVRVGSALFGARNYT